MFNKITRTFLDQIKQGVTPEKLALSIAFGVVLGTMPVLGITTTMCVFAAFIFRLNHVAIQSLNYIAYPVQILLIIPFIRLGEWIYGRSNTPLNIIEIIDQFKLSFKIAFQKYFILGLIGFTAWAIIAPMAFTIIYWISKKILVKMMTKVTLSDITMKN
ncbi:MAG: DUF2062 domain-containing protein [Bacteriovorax sp.]|nr:DUF2062 domain-containing protein [Bacteriovorax sp.]